jgi:chemotaxis protein CheD
MKGRNGKGQPLMECYLPPGHVHLAQEASLIWTVLGSCVAVALWDSQKRMGGMSHFLYPLTADKSKATAQYGNVAVRYLVKMFLDNGAEEADLKAQLFGGAQSESEDGSRIAKENLQMARLILKKYHIAVISEDTGGLMGRKLVYNTQNNEAIVYKVNTIRGCDWYPYDHE